MLDFIRRSTQGGFGKVIMVIAMGLLILSFAIWGINDVFRGGTDTAVARVGREKISIIEVQQTFQRQLAMIREQFGQGLDAEQARALGLDRRALMELIQMKLFDLAADDLGIGVPDTLLVKEIHNVPAFKGDTGSFDRNRFETFLRARNYTEASFLKAYRSDMIRSQLLNAMLGGLQVPDAMATPLMTFQGERRTVRYVIVPPEQAGTVPPATDEEIRARYEADKGSYMAPEYRRFTFVDLNPALLAKTITVKDEDIHARYEQQKDHYTAPEKRDLQQLIFQKPDDANAAAAALKGGKSFEDLARDQGKSAADIGIGEKTKSALPAKIADAVFAAPAGGVAGPLEGPFGWMLVRVVKITPAAARSFDELKGEIAADIAKERAADQTREIATQFEDARASGAPLEDAAKGKSLEVVSIVASDAEGKDPASAPIKALEGRKAILADAFKASPGNDPDMAQTPEGGYYVVRVDSVTPPAARPLDAVKETIRAALQSEKQRAALIKVADGLAAKGRAGTSIDALASSLGKAALKGGPLTRATDDDTFSPQAVRAVFAAKQGAFVTAPVKTGSGVVLMQIDGVEKPSPEEVAAAAAQVKPQIGEMLSNELFTLYADKLQTRYHVTVNDAALKTAVGGS
jgi:peptidyl-prolyl cis-trans isomerase D